MLILKFVSFFVAVWTVEKALVALTLYYYDDCPRKCAERIRIPFIRESCAILVLYSFHKPLTFCVRGSMYNNSALLRRHLWFTRWCLWLWLWLWLGLWLWLQLGLWFRVWCGGWRGFLLWWESLLFRRDSSWIHYTYRKGRGYLLVRKLTDVIFDSEDRSNKK